MINTTNSNEASNSKYNWRAFESLLKRVVFKGGYILPIETCNIIMDFVRCEICFIGESNYHWYKRATKMNKLSVIKAIPSWGYEKMPVNQLLHIACESETHNNLDLVRYLLDKGANMKLNGGTHHDTPLHKLCYSGNLDVLKYLVEQGANMNVKVKDGRTLLHIACEKGNFEIVKYLVEEYGATMEAKDRFNNTPLHLACKKGHLDVVKYLVEQGVDMEARCRYGSKR